MCKRTIVSECVTNGHPDKIADHISDALLERFSVSDPNVRAGIEVMVKDNIVVLGGEVTSCEKVDCDDIVRSVYDTLAFPPNHNLSSDKIKVINLIGKQSPEIHSGVDKSEDVIGAGDQGFVCGFATNETPAYLGLGHYIAKCICKYIEDADFIGPDAKSQVIVEYDEKGNAELKSILVSAMHYGNCDDIHDMKAVITEAIANNWMTMDENIHKKYILGQKWKLDINPCGPWHIGGPISDCGVTGRKLVVDQYGGYCKIGGGALCVDGDTEYLSDDLKWRKISEYSGEKVGQWNHGLLEFVKPSMYHVNDAEKMYHFENESLDMVLSENHDIVCETSKGNLHKVKVKDAVNKIGSLADGFKDSIPICFRYYEGKGISLTDDEIRLQVAFCADGTYNSVPGDKGRINIKKKHKIERLEYLLNKTGIEYHLLDKGEYHNHYYTFVPPVPNNKSLYSIFKDCNFRQMAIVAEEVLHWDGNVKSGIFRTTIKEDADFVQFLFNVVFGFAARINVDNRIGKTRKHLNGKEYNVKSITYEVAVGKNKSKSLMCKDEVSEYKTDKMYCFTVPSGMLLLRRNNKIFVTGNCGKDPTKVDRSAAYMCRYLAKNIVASGIANTAKVELSYMIGVPEPSSVYVWLDKNMERQDKIIDTIKKNIDLTPYGIMKRFGRIAGRYDLIGQYGHYGVPEIYFKGSKSIYDYYPWEKTDIKNLFKLKDSE